MTGREGRGPERPGPDYPPEWDREPADPDAPPPVTPADCRLIGAGDGSVMVYCLRCREALPHMPRRGTLDAAQELWADHRDTLHPAPVTDPWTDPDAAAAAGPPPF